MHFPEGWKNGWADEAYCHSGWVEAVPRNMWSLSSRDVVAPTLRIEGVLQAEQPIVLEGSKGTRKGDSKGCGEIVEVNGGQGGEKGFEWRFIVAKLHVRKLSLRRLM